MIKKLNVIMKSLFTFKNIDWTFEPETHSRSSDGTGTTSDTKEGSLLSMTIYYNMKI